MTVFLSFVTFRSKEFATDLFILFILGVIEGVDWFSSSFPSLERMRALLSVDIVKAV